jgi:hypothetical protein
LETRADEDTRITIRVGCLDTASSESRRDAITVLFYEWNNIDQFETVFSPAKIDDC